MTLLDPSGFPPEKPRRFEVLMADLDFTRAPTERKQIAIAPKPLRTFEGDK
jgi:hypothetical protein